MLSMIYIGLHQKTELFPCVIAVVGVPTTSFALLGQGLLTLVAVAVSSTEPQVNLVSGGRLNSEL